MRKLSFIMILLFCATFTYAQKGKVTQAISFILIFNDKVPVVSDFG